MDPMALMHVNGFSGAGKTTLALHLQETYGDKIIVKDLDDFLSTKSTKKSMEKSIDAFLRKHTKPVVFVGTAVNEPLKKLYPDFKCKHRMWLNVSLQTATEQALQRQLEWLCEHKTQFIHMTHKMTPKQEEDYIMTFYSFHDREKSWQPLHALCKSLGYKNATAGQISSQIRKDLRLH